MSETTVIPLRNISGKPQTCVFQGKQHVLGPNETSNYDVELATKFLERCAPFVEVVAAPIISTGTAKTTWVANVSGDPREPETIEKATMDRAAKKIVYVTAPNPNRVPHTAARELKGGHEQYETKHGLFLQKTLPHKMVVVPPHTRVEMEAGVANWFLNREQTSSVRPSCIMSRPPTAFEPTLSWDLDDIRNYLRLTDTTADLGPDEASVVRNAQKAHEAKVAQMVTDGKELSDTQRKVDLKHEIAEGLRAAKGAAMNTLYFRLVDPEYKLPTREEFNEFVYGAPDTELSDTALEEILAKADADEKEQKVKKAGRKARVDA